MDVPTIVKGAALIIGTVLLPGIALSYGIRPKGLETSERFGMALALGLSPYLLIYFLAKNVGLSITQASVAGVLAVLVAIGGITYFLKRRPTIVVE